jgi:hypothetical protein
MRPHNSGRATNRFTVPLPATLVRLIDSTFWTPESPDASGTCTEPAAPPRLVIVNVVLRPATPDWLVYVTVMPGVPLCALPSIHSCKPV